MKTWHFFRFLATCCAPPPKIEKNAFKKIGVKFVKRDIFMRRYLYGKLITPVLVDWLWGFYSAKKFLALKIVNPTTQI